MRRFQGIRSDSYGGAVYFSNTAYNASITDSLFNDCSTTSDCGALYCYSQHGDLSRICFTLCSASYYYHAFYFFVPSADSSLNVNDFISVYRCPPELESGSIIFYQLYGKITNEHNNMSQCRISDYYNFVLDWIRPGSVIQFNTFSDNRGNYFSYFHRYDSTANYTVQQCTFVNNVQQSSSSLILTSESYAFTFSSCLFRLNNYSSLYHSSYIVTIQQNNIFCNNLFTIAPITDNCEAFYTHTHTHTHTQTCLAKPNTETVFVFRILVLLP